LLSIVVVRYCGGFAREAKPIPDVLNAAIRKSYGLMVLSLTLWGTWADVRLFDDAKYDIAGGLH
jgi:hypothetical protein